MVVPGTRTAPPLHGDPAIVGGGGGIAIVVVVVLALTVVTIVVVIVVAVVVAVVGALVVAFVEGGLHKAQVLPSPPSPPFACRTRGCCVAPRVSVSSHMVVATAVCLAAICPLIFAGASSLGAISRNFTKPLFLAIRSFRCVHYGMSQRILIRADNLIVCICTVAALCMPYCTSEAGPCCYAIKHFPYFMGEKEGFRIR